MAEGVGFEPTEPLGPLVFKTSSLSHSDTLLFKTSVKMVGATGIEPIWLGCRPSASAILPCSHFGAKRKT